MGNRKIQGHFCLCVFSSTKPVTDSLLGPQLRVSHLALTVLLTPQCAKTNICRATLKTRALKLLGLTANNKQIKQTKKFRETKIEPVGGNFAESS